MTSVTESAPRACLESVGWQTRQGAGNATGMLAGGQRLHDALFPKLISGELRVADVEKILEDAV